MIEYSIIFKNVKEEFNELLKLRKNSPTRDEKVLQGFFEKNPSALIPAIEGVPADYNIFGHLVVSQPKFCSVDGDRYPDFLIVTWNSLNLYFNFIELEDPCKKIFKPNSEDLTGDFDQALGQINKWQSFSKGEVDRYCNELLRSLFKNNFNNTSNKQIHFNYILVYGFSDEIIGLSERHNHILQNRFKDNLFHCTYSRMQSSQLHVGGLFTVKKDPSINRFKAIGLMPFKNYKIDEWSDFGNISGKEEIIISSQYLSKEEKEDLIKNIQTIDILSKEQINKIIMEDMGTKMFSDFDL